MPARWQLEAGRVALRLLSAWERLRLRLPEAEAAAPMPWTRRRLVVAGVQWRLEPVRSLRAWWDRLQAVMDDAYRTGSALVVFPEDMATPLLGLLTERWPTPTAAQLADEDVGRYLRAWADTVGRVYREVFAHLARRYGVTVVAGSQLAWVGRRFWNQALVFGPNGRLVHRQPKLHPIPVERRWGIEPGREWRRVERIRLPLGVAVCHDASFFETYRMAAQEGVELMAIPIADPDPDWGEAKARRGAWARTQQSGLPSVVGAGTGTLFGLALTGKAGIYVPAELTADGSGVLAESREPVGEGVVTAALDLDALAAFRAEARPGPPADLLQTWLVPGYRTLVGDEAGSDGAEADQARQATGPASEPVRSGTTRRR
jgi:predicted amidohydrolase